MLSLFSPPLGVLMSKVIGKENNCRMPEFLFPTLSNSPPHVHGVHLILALRNQVFLTTSMSDKELIL